MTNTGEQPHFMELIRVPAGTTANDILGLIGMAATPESGGINPEAIEGMGGLSTISPGVTGYIELNLTPGTYVAVCFVPDHDSGAPHIMLGMISVFTVGDAGATPAA